MIWTTRPRSELGGLACLRAGAGEPVVLIHGVGLRAEAWGAQIPALSERFETIALDLPGHGESPSLNAGTVLTDWVDTFAGAIATLGAPVLLAGHSLGALLALEIAMRRPELCRGVAALNAVYRRSPDARAAVQARAAALAGAERPDPAPTLRRWFGEDVDSAEATACRDWLNTVPLAGYCAAYALFAASDGPTDHGLASLGAPALFLTGAGDPNSTPAMSAAMAARAPNGRVETVAGAAHMLPMTHPARVNETLLAFFEECGGGRDR